jgi:hypothetical protein
MIEHLNYNNFGEREVFLKWAGSWYRIPFFLLEALYNEWAKRGRTTESKSLLAWILLNEHTHKNDIAIPEIKKILKTEMPYMTAYLMDGCLEKAQALVEEEFNNAKVLDQWMAEQYPEKALK